MAHFSCDRAKVAYRAALQQLKVADCPKKSTLASRQEWTALDPDGL